MGILKGFSKILNRLFFPKRACFSRHLVLGIYAGNSVRNRGIRRNHVSTNDVQAKRILLAPILDIYVICVHFHTYQII